MRASGWERSERISLTSSTFTHSLNLYSLAQPVLTRSTFTHSLNLYSLASSRRYLMSKKKQKEARESLQILRKGESPLEIDSELHQIATSLSSSSSSSSKSASVAALLHNPLARSRLFVCIALQAFQQMAGINAIVYFTPLILREAGVDAVLAKIGVADPNQASLLCTLIAYGPKIPALMLASRLMDTMGRRAMLLNFVPVMGASLAGEQAAKGASFRR